MSGKIFAAALAGSLTLGAGASHATDRASPVVKTESGTVRGAVADGILSFKGIPFAAPPVDALRWRAPQPVTPWQGVKTTTHYAHDCAQKLFPSDAAPLGTTPAEDCLYLNVWRPAAVADEKLPVMVWIYGGGFVNGGASPPTYSGAPIAADGVLVVSFNYRLGRFGFFDHPGLPDTETNDGFLDQIAALQWVKRNIAAFGGDPDKVTIVGESAGGISAHMLLTSSRAKGLFRGAVIESGGSGTGFLESPAQAKAEGSAFAATKGIHGDGPDAIARLRALPASEIIDGLNLTALFNPPPGPKTFSSPILDGKIAVDAASAYQHGDFAHVPVMIGATSGDIGGPDGVMVRGARTLTRAIAQQGVPVYYYRFSYVADSARAASPHGAHHATDIPFFLGTTGIKYGPATTPIDLAANDLAKGYLVSFVKTGNPSAAGRLLWPAWTPDAPSMLDFTPSGTAALEKDTE